jgi:hypothetical protein
LQGLGGDSTKNVRNNTLDARKFGQEDKNNNPAQFIGFKSLPIGRKFPFDDPIGNNPNGADTHQDIRQCNANNQDG